MLMAVFTTFAVSRKEPLGEVVERVHAAFAAAGFGEPAVRFSMSDPPETPNAAALGIKRVSSAARVLKRWPELDRFSRLSGSEGRQKTVISNGTDDGAAATVDFAILKEIADGVPKSFPFQRITLHFHAAGFSEGQELPNATDPRSISSLARAGVDVFAGVPTTAGVSVTDSWSANGRQRTLAALRLVEADPAAKKLPAVPANVHAIFSACGKVRKTIQVPVVLGPSATGAPACEIAAPRAGAPSGSSEAVRAVVLAYRGKMAELLRQLPHDLPHRDGSEADSPTLAGAATTGPKKPELARAFAAMGYDCRGENGSFRLQRQTDGHLTVQVHVDIGGWGRTVNATMQVIGLPKDQATGPGYKAILKLPLSAQAVRGVAGTVEHVGQFPIGGPDRWRRIVENLAYLVGTLDRSFVPEIEAVLGPSPEWFQPETA